MTCEHLREIEEAMLAAGIVVTFRGRAWSDNCREWVYFDCFIDTDAVWERFSPAACVAVHEHRGTHDGRERGFVCRQCHDGIMGDSDPRPGRPAFAG